MEKRPVPFIIGSQWLREAQQRVGLQLMSVGVWLDGLVGKWGQGGSFVFLLMIKAVKAVKENVEGADGRVWRRGRARCKLSCRHA